MQIGLNIGPSIGPRFGAAPPGGFSMASVARDATSNIYLPASAAQWTQTLGVAGITTGGPSALYLLQEAAGNPADSIGSFTLTASGTLAYQQSVAGWTTKGIKTTGGSSGIMQTSSASLPNISSTSLLVILYALMPATAPTTQSVISLGPTFASQAGAQLINSTNKKLNAIADPNTAAGADDATSQVRPLVLKIDRTAAVCTLYSDLEKLSPTLNATPTGKAFILGGDNTQTFFPPTMTFMYDALFFAGAAELTDAKVRTLLQTLGWSPAW